MTPVAVALFAFLFLATNLAAQPLPDGTPGDSERAVEYLRLPPLDGFESTPPARHRTGFRRFYRRPGDTATNWSELVMIGNNSDWKDRTPIDIGRMIAATYRDTCGTLDVRSMKPETEGGYPVLVMTLTCRDAKPGGAWFGLQDLRRLEFTAIKLIQGKNHFYTVQRFWHSDTETEPGPMTDPTLRRQWQAFTAQTKLCDRNRPDPACATGPSPGAGREALYVTRPDGFDPGAPKGQGNMRMLELVPHGESLEDWTEILTFTTETGTRNRDIKRYVETLVALQRKQCRSVDATLSEVRRDKGYAVIDFETTCRDPRPQTGGAGVVLRRLEFLRGRVIQGTENFHTVQRGWHSDSAKEPAPLADPRLRESWDAFFETVDVCDRRVAGQACRGSAPVF